MTTLSLSFNLSIAISFQKEERFQVDNYWQNYFGCFRASGERDGPDWLDPIPHKAHSLRESYRPELLSLNSAVSLVC